MCASTVQPALSGGCHFPAASRALKKLGSHLPDVSNDATVCWVMSGLSSHTPRTLVDDRGVMWVAALTLDAIV
eukprot:4875311-Amphidinium_carterae.1